METIIALLMFVGVDQKLVEMTWTPSIKQMFRKKELQLETATQFICVLKSKLN